MPDPILDRLRRLHPKKIDLSLGRLSRLLSRLGDPQTALPPTIHVAGTNGKGSTVAMLRAIHEAAGRRVHVYTSPHLVRFSERIVLAGTTIEEDRVADLLLECEQVNADAPITLFEITTAAAFLAFSRTNADLLLLEVGLGGRFDATNVVEMPILSIITPVSLDHQHFLGSTIEAIAFEKAGILKPEVPAVIGRQPGAARQVILDRAAGLGVPTAVFGRDWQVDATTGPASAIVFKAGRIIRHLPRPALPGRHQIDNAGLALAATELLQTCLPASPAALAHGLRAVSWPARLQRLTRGPMVAALPAGTDLWVDGGHNAEAAAAIAETVSVWRGDIPDRSIHLIFGGLNSRDPADFLGPFRGLADSVHTVAIPDEASAIPAITSAAAACAQGLSAQPADSVALAVEQACAAEAAERRILICGSLYLAGTVLRDHG